jgi:hypothetical protein
VEKHNATGPEPPATSWCLWMPSKRPYRGLKDLAKVASFGLLGESDFFMVLQKRS